MIIKKWTGSAWQAESVKVNAADIVVNVTAGTPVSLFSGGTSAPKILPAYLPDSVFDSLKFYGTQSGNVNAIPDDTSQRTLASVLINAYYSTGGRSIVGYYWVISTAGTITGVTGKQENIIPVDDPGDGEYATLQFRPQDGGSSATANTSSGALEVGDWFVIESVTGAGTSGSPWVFTASVINNSYEIMNGATSGSAGAPGLVPTPAAGQQNYFLRGDATWVIPTDTNTTYSVSTVNGGDAYTEIIRLTAGGSGSGTDDVTLAVGAVGSTYGLTIEQASDVITFKHADTSSQASVNGSGRTYIQDITLDEYGHVTAIGTATETVTDTNTTYDLLVPLGTTAIRLIDNALGTDDITLSAGTGMSITRNSESQLTFTPTAYTAGNGISLSSFAFSVGAGVGLTQEATGLKMENPIEIGLTTPAAGYQIQNGALWFDLNP